MSKLSIDARPRQPVFRVHMSGLSGMSDFLLFRKCPFCPFLVTEQVFGFCWIDTNREG